MSIAIRLSRGGAKKRPYYRIVVANSRAPRDGRFIEKIGTYNPLLAKDSPDRIKLDADRARHWLSVGAQPSDRVLRFLDAAGVKERAPRNNPNKGEAGEKMKERAEERATKQAELEAAAAEAAANPPAPVEEAPVEETPVEEAATQEPAADEVLAEEAAAETPIEPAPAEAAPVETTTIETAQAAEPTPPAPPEDAPNSGESTDSPAEGDADAAPSEGAEKGTDQ